MLKKLFSKQHLCLFVFLLVGFSSFAQQTSLDESETPNPLKKLETSFYPALKKPIKSFIWIIDKDTISKSYYDKKGNEHTKLDYENNKPFYKSLHTYTGPLITKTTFYIHDMLQSTTAYQYNADKKLSKWQTVKTVYDKKTGTVTLVDDVQWIIEYNQHKKAIKKFSVDALKVKKLMIEYFYDATNQLIATNELQWKEQYEYKNGLLTNKNRFFKNDNSLYAASEFKYNGEGLLIESTDKYYTAGYSYESSKLKKAIYNNKKEKTYQAIDFFYNNDLLSKVEINTTDLYLKPAFIFKTDYLYFSWSKKEPNQLKMEFVYDKHNNVIEIKYFIKDVYKYSKYFVYEYY